jgi:hypothetical protein
MQTSRTISSDQSTPLITMWQSRWETLDKKRDLEGLDDEEEREFWTLKYVLAK